MSRPNIIAMVVPVVSATGGAAVDVSRMSDLKVAIAGTFDATYRVQFSNDGTTWTNASATTHVDAAGVEDMGTLRCKLLRIYNDTDYTSGTPTASVWGLETVSAR